MRLFLSNLGNLKSCILTTSCILRGPKGVLTSLVSPSNFVTAPFGGADLLIIETFEPESKSTWKSLWLLIVPIISAVVLNGEFWYPTGSSLQVLILCRRPIILHTVQGYFWHPRQGQTLYVWGGQTIEAGFPKRQGKDLPCHCLNAGLPALMQDWAFLRRCSILDIRFFHGMFTELPS
jgi:hypothetical protein